MMGSEMEPFGVAVLFNDSDSLIKGEPRDRLAEHGVVACAHAIADTLHRKGFKAALVPFRSEVEMALDPYPPTDWVVFNLGEGLEGRLFEEARIAWALEAMGYQFTGARGDALSRSLHKAAAKTVLSANRVNTPQYWLFRHPHEVDALGADMLVFPLIVKPVAEGASIGIGPDAVVHTIQELRERVAYVVRQYRQAVLAEVFVVGREFNIALWGDPPKILPLAEIDFSAFANPFECIVSFAAKWEQDSFEYHHTPVLCPAPVDPDLGVHIEETAQRAWAAIGCQGYARVDMRIDDMGIAYVVEVNCNPDLSSDAGFYCAVRAAGYSYEDMIVRILEIARRESSVYDRNSIGDGWPVNPDDYGRDRHFYTSRDQLRRGTLARVSR